MSVQLTVFDGTNCIGGNKIHLAADGTNVFFDFGLNYSIKSQFFDEFLRPRSSLGLVDYLSTGLLPPIPGIYRDDLVPPGVNLWHRYNGTDFGDIEPQAILLSHAHNDHLQLVSFLKPHIPIYSSIVSAVIAKTQQDTGQGGADSETTSIVIKEEWEGLLRSKHYRTSPALGRPYIIVDRNEIAAEVQKFWASPSSSRSLQAVPLQVWADNSNLGIHRESDRQKPYAGRVGSLNTLFFPVDHSIPGSGAWAVETSEGWVVYTGDLRMHGCTKYDTLHFIEYTANLKPLALICEATHPESEWFMSEDAVYENARIAIELSRQLVIADFSLTNIERLLTFYRIAKDTARTLVITFKDAYLLEELSKVIPDIPNPLVSSNLRVYGPNKVNLASWERVLAERYVGKIIQSGEIQRSTADFILCFGYYDLPNLVDINPGNGHFIRSSSEPFHEQMVLDMERLHTWLDHFNIQYLCNDHPRQNISIKNQLKSPFHASGHMTGRELLDLIERIRPRYVIPVHTEKPNLIRQMVRARMGSAVQTILPKAGQPLMLKR